MSSSPSSQQQKQEEQVQTSFTSSRAGTNSNLSDEEMRKLLKPNPSKEEVLSALRASYLTGRQSAKIIKELDSYDDRNYLVEIIEKDEDNDTYGNPNNHNSMKNQKKYHVLAKVHNGVESDAYLSIEMENSKRRIAASSTATTTTSGSSSKQEPHVADGESIKTPDNDHHHHHDNADEGMIPKTSQIDLQNYIFQHLSDNKEKYGGIQTSVCIPVTNHPHHPDPSAFHCPNDTKHEEMPSSSSLTSFHKTSSTSTPPLVSVHTLPVMSTTHGPRKLVLRLLTYLPGKPMSTIHPLPIETLAQAGAYLGKLCMALDDLSKTNALALKAATRYHAWDGRNTCDLLKFAPCIQNERRRALVQNVISTFRKTFVETQFGETHFRKGILHGDYNDANILMNEEGDISGVIDFGDSTYSWRVLDITVAMAYAMLSTYGKCGRSIAAASAMLRGFHSTYPLTTEEREHLRLLIASRLSCSVTIGAYSYQQDPTNEYLLLHSEPAWKALELIWGEGSEGPMAEAFDRMFDAACDRTEMTGGNIDCSDLTIPDPHIVDLMSTVRVSSDFTSNRPGLSTKKRRLGRGVGGVLIGDKPIVTFVTGNVKKLEEVRRILSRSVEGKETETVEDRTSSELPFVLANHSVDLPELQGDPNVIAGEKCTIAAAKVGGPVITEDTSLCFTALKGLPGPYVKWFLDKCGHDGLNNMIAFSEDKSAYAQTVVAFCAGPGMDVVVFEGRTEGKIVPPRGPPDFAWDPIFEPDEGGGLTYAEMTKGDKDAISHRSRAFIRLRDYLMTDDVIKKLHEASTVRKSRMKVADFTEEMRQEKVFSNAIVEHTVT